MELLVLLVRILLNPILSMLVGVALIVVSCQARAPSLHERVARVEAKSGNEVFVEGVARNVDGKSIISADGTDTTALVIATAPSERYGDRSGTVKAEMVPFAIEYPGGRADIIGPLESMEGFSWTYKAGFAYASLVPGEAVAILGVPVAKDRFASVTLVRNPSEWRKWLTPDPDSRPMFRWLGLGFLAISIIGGAIYILKR